MEKISTNTIAYMMFFSWELSLVVVVAWLPGFIHGFLQLLPVVVTYVKVKNKDCHRNQDIWDSAPFFWILSGTVALFKLTNCHLSTTTFYSVCLVLKPCKRFYLIFGMFTGRVMLVYLVSGFISSDTEQR